jgi:hypothetical protein
VRVKRWIFAARRLGHVECSRGFVRSHLEALDDDDTVSRRARSLGDPNGDSIMLKNVLVLFALVGLGSFGCAASTGDAEPTGSSSAGVETASSVLICPKGEEKVCWDTLPNGRPICSCQPIPGSEEVSEQLLLCPKGEERVCWDTFPDGRPLCSCQDIPAPTDVISEQVLICKKPEVKVCDDTYPNGTPLCVCELPPAK